MPNFNHPPIAQHQSPPSIKWDKYLINGELKTWNGPVERVYSPMGKVDQEGRVDRVF